MQVEVIKDCLKVIISIFIDSVHNALVSGSPYVCYTGLNKSSSYTSYNNTVLLHYTSRLVCD